MTGTQALKINLILNVDSGSCCLLAIDSPLPQAWFCKAQMCLLRVQTLQETAKKGKTQMVLILMHVMHSRSAAATSLSAPLH